MKHKYLLFVSLVLFGLPAYLCSQPAWTGILLPTSGPGACTVGSSTAPGQCAIDWTQSGIPGGIPSNSWTQSGATITAAQSPCSNGAGDCTATIQAALNACGGSKYVLLGAGTFQIANANGLVVPDHCVLRGAGANQTILKGTGPSGGGPGKHQRLADRQQFYRDRFGIQGGIVEHRGGKRNGDRRVWISGRHRTEQSELCKHLRQ